VIDGEIVALDDNGRPSFNLLQNYASREYTLVFYLFDLLILEGEDQEIESLEVRRQLLSTRLMPRLAEPIRFCETTAFGVGNYSGGAGAGFWSGRFPPRKSALSVPLRGLSFTDKDHQGGEVRHLRLGSLGR
jgi:hypothetical protein